MDSCNLTQHDSSIVGPVQVFESMSHWSTAVYIILGLHLLPVWAAAISGLLHLRQTTPQRPGLLPPLAWLVSVPPALMSLATVGIVVPSTGPFVEILLEVVLAVAMVCFVKYVVAIFGKEDVLVDVCNAKKVVLPLGAPPFCFLQGCHKPPISYRNLALVTFFPKLLVVVKLVVFVVEVILTVLQVERTNGFLGLDTIHLILQLPIGLLCMYFYTMFLFIAMQIIGDNSKRFLGFVILLLVVFFDCLRIFFIFLTGTGMLTCVPPHLTLLIVVDFLKNIIKGFLTTFCGLPFIQLCVSSPLVPLKEGGESQESIMAVEGGAGADQEGSSQGGDNPRKRSVLHSSSGPRSV